jgi:hypothetical protein
MTKFQKVGTGTVHTRESDGKKYLSLVLEFPGDEKPRTILLFRSEDGESWDALSVNARDRTVAEPTGEQANDGTRTGRSIDGRRQWTEDNSESPF